jgi:hypothetical protein
MPTALKARRHPRRRRQLSTSDNRTVARLRARPLEPEFDDQPMVAVYAVSSVLIVVGLFLLSV